MTELDWSNPDYEAVFLERANRLKRLREKPELMKALKLFYKDNPVDFINDWGQTIEPRNIEIGKRAIIPFILFPKQKDFINWLLARWRARESGLAEKSRDMGCSWLCVGFAVWLWIFFEDACVGFGSRKEEYVDKIGDPKSLFEKIRKFIDLLPADFKPNGYVESKHALSMRIINPENGSSIIGEAGDNIGRGARTSIYFKDESAFYLNAEAIEASLSQTSNCKIDISTPNGNANVFYQKRHGGKINVFTFRWQDDPRKNQEWYEKQKTELSPVILAQEVDIDYNASTSDAFISGDVIIAAQHTLPADIEIVGKWIVGVDAAHMGDDSSVIHARRGRYNAPQKVYNKMDGLQLAGAVIAYCDALSRSAEIFAIIIELDGPGVSCYDNLKQSIYANVVKGVHTGARLKDNKHYNLKAKMCMRAKEYLEEPPVLLPNDPDLKSELSSMKYSYKDGMILMQSKKEYKKLYGKSPDKADAFCLTFAIENTKMANNTLIKPKENNIFLQDNYNFQKNGWLAV